MPTETCWALKEWAAVCAALASGRQMLILRKGGVAEGPQGFQVERPEFWLLPTRFHQSADDLQPDAAPLLDAAAELAPPPGRLRIDLFAVAESVRRLDDWSDVEPLISLQSLSPATIRERFDYRRPGLWVLGLRVYRRAEPHWIDDSPQYAGCHSWVELDGSLPAEALSPVLTDDEFRARLAPLSAAPTGG